MIYLPPLRRLLFPSLLLLIFVLAYRSSHRINRSYISSLLISQPVINYPEERIQVSELNSQKLVIQDHHGHQIIPPQELYYDYVHDEPAEAIDRSFQEPGEPDVGPRYVEPKDHKHLAPLFECKITPNKYTQHIRLPSYIRRISMMVNGETENEKRKFLNAAPMSLPSWAENQYLLVTRVQTDGTSQLNIICEANICYTDETQARPGEKKCTEQDLELLGGVEGLRCATPPLTLNVPPTAAKTCGKETGALIDIPGFHDPRIFWSGKGEPLMMMNTQSQYACFGLWVIDLRKVHAPLNNLLGSNPKMPTLGPLMSYPSMTEITRNPPETRGTIEKNWMFFSSAHSTYVHYDLGPTVRTFAQILGGGLTSENLTDPYENPCLMDGAKPKDYEVWGGSWHQGTNSLRLVLCDRSDRTCKQRPENTVFWSLIHHKHKNYYALPLRYERYFIVWASTPPFQMLAMSRHPIILYNETVSGWNQTETWDDDLEQQQMLKEGKEGKGDFAVFTYTPSIAYAWGRADDMPQDKNTGYLDDEVIMGIGIDDEDQAYARAKVSDLLQCMRTCPGRSPVRLDHAADRKKKSSFFEEDDKIRDTITKGLKEGKTLGEIANEGLLEKETGDGRRPEEAKFDDPVVVIEEEVVPADEDDTEATTEQETPAEENKQEEQNTQEDQRTPEVQPKQEEPIPPRVEQDLPESGAGLSPQEQRKLEQQRRVEDQQRRRERKKIEEQKKKEEKEKKDQEEQRKKQEDEERKKKQEEEEQKKKQEEDEQKKKQEEEEKAKDKATDTSKEQSEEAKPDQANT